MASIVGLVADTYDVSETGLTSGDATRRLESAGCEEELITRLRTFFEACDGARYGGAGEHLEAAGHQAEALLGDLTSALQATSETPGSRY